ncbi:AAA family ATPase [Pseudobacteriovorax antillogorgiicola]|uniref:MoxR-like ATPase n=1 Tax=Pseudobacteriovorax antillogorgiicola TaxID=1513793 RepID=A0A1Y6C302_9BACT|nr:MoxR family ATPase [Pseudobacteriovorax antillogorgiicola]TCS50709.1 MoxR-like ATPase [Pseudobacteriovorax antillogorgiicola]SMF40594.1 MoxR-like ATPase [Pseudobacteriovorax antillogorgiicola]
MSQNMSFQSSNSYIASDELIEIVNVAVDLERPLLIRGEPGTGKTLLARAVAESLQMPLLTWHVKSTSKAQDGLYVYDTVQRLNDSRFGSGDVSNIKDYIKLGPLGQAFQGDQRTIVLIDEIDKADIEFPNDLLHELDAMSFHIPETGETIAAQKRPVIIITSNAEKELPDAFLRRCVFHYISFPDQAQMEKIVKVHHPDIEQKLIDQCLVKFYWLREQDQIRKKPSTSELVDWIGALARSGIPLKRLEKDIPFMGILLKKEQDLQALNNRGAPSGRSRFL